MPISILPAKYSINRNDTYRAKEKQTRKMLRNSNWVSSLKRMVRHREIRSRMCTVVLARKTRASPGSAVDDADSTQTTHEIHSELTHSARKGRAANANEKMLIQMRKENEHGVGHENFEIRWRLNVANECGMKRAKTKWWILATNRFVFFVRFRFGHLSSFRLLAITHLFHLNPFRWHK